MKKLLDSSGRRQTTLDRKDTFEQAQRVVFAEPPPTRVCNASQREIYRGAELTAPPARPGCDHSQDKSRGW